VESERGLMVARVDGVSIFGYWLFANVVALGVMGLQDQEARAMWRGGRRGSTTGM